MTAARRQPEAEEEEAAATLHGICMRTLTLKDLVEFFSHLENAFDIINRKDPNVERSGLTLRRIMQDAAWYMDILQEKRAVAQQASKTRESDEPQPSTAKKQPPQARPRVNSHYPTAEHQGSRRILPSLPLTSHFVSSSLTSHLLSSLLSFRLS